MRLELTVGDVCLKADTSAEFAEAKRQFEGLGLAFGGKLLYRLELKDPDGQVILRRSVIHRAKSVQSQAAEERLEYRANDLSPA